MLRLRRIAPASLLGCALALLVTSSVAGCKKKKEPVVVTFDATPPPESPADKEARDLLAVMRSYYPAVCDTEAASRRWIECRDREKSYELLHRCAETALGDVRRSLETIKASTEEHLTCGEELRKTSVALLNAAPKLFGDVMKWLEENHDKLAPQLANMPLAELCRTKREACAGEPQAWQDAYRPMRITNVDTLDCAAKLLRCGTKQDIMDCWPSNIAPRLGIACSAADNRSGGGPEDMLWVRESGTPLSGR